MPRANLSRRRDRSSLLFSHLFEYMNALILLPHLIWIFVFIEFQKFPVRIYFGLNLIEFIVTKCANKPRARAPSFRLPEHVQSGKSRLAIASEIVGRAEVLPVGQVVAIKLECGLQFFFRIGKLAFFEENAPKPAG